jgi:hypothetical protein
VTPDPSRELPVVSAECDVRLHALPYFLFMLLRWNPSLSGTSPSAPCTPCNLSLYLTKYNTMKTYWKSGSIAPRILNPGARGEWSASRSGRFISRERSLFIHWIGDWSGPRSWSRRGGKTKKKIRAPAGNRTPVVQPLA